MALKKTSLVIPKNLDGTRLDQALAELLPAAAGMELSKGKIRKLVIAGAVYLNTGRVRIASKTVRAGARIDVYIDPKKLLSDAESQGRTPDGMKAKEWKFSASDLLYEDEWIVGVNKPAGIPTQPTLDEARANLYALLKKFFKERDGGEGYVGLHHRLDRDTSGAMLFTKTKEPNGAVGKIFQEHLAQKTYLAIVSYSGAALPAQWDVDDYLARDKGKAGKMRSVKSGGDRAITAFRTLAQTASQTESGGGGGFALVEAKPKTGRMHQIRVHLSERGTPIVGDRSYGGSVKAPGGEPVLRVMLHAAALTFPHPITKLEICFQAFLPADFEKCLTQHRLPLPSSKDSGNAPRS